MGACDFYQFQPDTGHFFNDQFDTARESAAWEHGHGGYTGTLAEKHDVVVIDEAGECSTPGEAEALARLLVNDDDPRITDKWGPAGAIRVDGDKPGWLFFGWASS